MIFDFSELLPLQNWTLLETASLYLELLTSSLHQHLYAVGEHNNTYQNTPETPEGDSAFFNEFQQKLFKYFLSIIIFNIFGICVVWNIYGAKISTRFMKTANQRTIEDLKKSVSMLKLPQEHSPRI